MPPQHLAEHTRSKEDHLQLKLRTKKVLLEKRIKCTTILQLEMQTLQKSQDAPLIELVETAITELEKYFEKLMKQLQDDVPKR